MATTNKTRPATAMLAIQDLQLALIREELAWKDWEPTTALFEIEVMKRICKKAAWSEAQLPLVEAVSAALNLAARVVAEKDTTRLAAAHTSLAQAVYALRDQQYR